MLLRNMNDDARVHQPKRKQAEEPYQTDRIDLSIHLWAARYQI